MAVHIGRDGETELNTGKTKRAFRDYARHFIRRAIITPSDATTKNTCLLSYEPDKMRVCKSSEQRKDKKGMKKIDIVTFINNGFFVRYASGKTATYTKKTLPQTVLNWILEPDTIPHDITTDNGLICGTNYKKGATK